MKHLINMTSMLGNRNVLNLFRIASTTSSSFSTVARKLDFNVCLTSANSCEQQTRRTYAKKSAQLTEAQIQFQKHTAELGFKEKTSIRGTLYEFHDVETSIKYMQSEAFKTAYGDKLIWQWYIRNHKGRFPRLLTREKCIGTDGRYTTGNPCPVCRDPYLVVNFRNSDLLRHFVSPDTGYLLPARVTNVCRKTQENLLVAYEKACDHGLIEHPIPHRHYDYSIYNPYDKKTTRSEGEAVDEQERPSVLLGVILGANRKQINKIYDELNEEDISLGIKAKNE